MTLIYDDYLQASNGTGEAVRSNVVVARPIGSTEINVDTVLNWPTKFIATSGVLDTVTGTLAPDTITVFFGHINGTYLEIDEYAPGYSDNGNAANEIIVLKPTTPWSDKVAFAVTNAVHKADTSLAGNGFFLDEDNMASNSATKVPSQQSIKAYVDAAIIATTNASWLALLPVGATWYGGTNSANPSTYLPGHSDSTWVANAVGQTIFGKAASGTFATAGATGGAETVTLTIAQMPYHNHGDSSGGGVVWGSVNGTWVTTDNRMSINTAGGGYPLGYSSAVGGGGPHPNLPPYKVEYIWKRTA